MMDDTAPPMIFTLSFEDVVSENATAMASDNGQNRQ